ncbi:MAG: hypothetical protein KJ709_00535 [Nanoarchaeota archaeon]|nr:hypothetical protein [Nanoarchaeota archaeon]
MKTLSTFIILLILVSAVNASYGTARVVRVQGNLVTFEHNITSYPENETSGCTPLQFRGFYEVIYDYWPGGKFGGYRVYSDDDLPYVEQVTYDFQHNTNYTVDVYFQENNWGQCPYYSYYLGRLNFTTPTFASSHQTGSPIILKGTLSSAVEPNILGGPRP